MTEHGGLQEIIRSRRAPFAFVFKERVVENMAAEPVVLTSHRQHEELQKMLGVRWIGDEGMKEIRQRRADRLSDGKKRMKEKIRNGGFGEGEGAGESIGSRGERSRAGKRRQGSILVAHGNPPRTHPDEWWPENHFAAGAFRR